MKAILKGLRMIISGIGGLVIFGLVVMALFGVFDNKAEEIGNAEIFKGNDTKSAFSNESQVRVTEDEQNRSSLYLQKGYSYEMENGSELAITDIDIIYDFTNRSTIGYVSIEYTNNGSNKEYLSSNDISAFVDDFQEPVDTSVSIMIDNVEYRGEILEIDPGRKGRYVYFTLFPISGETADKVELSLFDAPILFKEDGQWLYTDEHADAIKAQTQK